MLNGLDVPEIVGHRNNVQHVLLRQTEYTGHHPLVVEHEEHRILPDTANRRFNALPVFIRKTNLLTRIKPVYGLPPSFQYQQIIALAKS